MGYGSGVAQMTGDHPSPLPPLWKYLSARLRRPNAPACNRFRGAGQQRSCLLCAVSRPRARLALDMGARPARRVPPPPPAASEPTLLQTRRAQSPRDQSPRGQRPRGQSPRAPEAVPDTVCGPPFFAGVGCLPPAGALIFQEQLRARTASTSEACDKRGLPAVCPRAPDVCATYPVPHQREPTPAPTSCCAGLWVLWRGGCP
jgi:hypothetical protein